MDRRTVGVEEEFLLVDAQGLPQPLGDLVVATALGNDADGRAGSGEGSRAAGEGEGTRAAGERRGAGSGDGSGADGGGPGGVEHELHQEQAEIGTVPCVDLGQLQADLARRRHELAHAAADRDSSIAALGTCPVPVAPTPTPEQRYLTMMRTYGMTAQEQLTCGCHVHVGIGSRAEGIGVLNGIRPWLAVVSALTVNSPFWQGEDTGYASYRRMVWDRWPGSGPTEVFDGPQEYDDALAALIRSGVLLDEGMVYFDARLSARYPTVEIRVADVCPEPADAVLVAGLCRGLVDTAAREHAEGVSWPRVRVDLLRGASWRAARSGLSGDLVDVTTGTAVPATTMVERLVDHIRPALQRHGDLDAVEASLDRVMRRGTGAELQRAAFARSGTMADVVADAVRRTSHVSADAP